MKGAARDDTPGRGESPGEAPGRIRPALLDILACPKCGAPVWQDGERIRCRGSGCGLAYPIRDGIPVMLVAEAETPAGGGR